VLTARDAAMAWRARRRGARYALRIVREARRAGLDPALAFALVQRESDFRNVFGNDPAGPPQVRGQPVTRGHYLRYRELRDRGHGAQGVGLTQLTWPSFQDAADGLGGCWKVKAQLRVGLEVLAGHVRKRGERAGVAAYNGLGPRAERYAEDVIGLTARWERILAAADRN
jgi:hypothetical protein